MSEEITGFSYIEIEKRRFHRFKNPILLNDVDIDNIFISNKDFF